MHYVNPHTSAYVSRCMVY